jgi:methylated-DNA-[protein]-cysteine S-methyltransferase
MKTNKVNVIFYSSPYGELLLGSFKGQLCLCDWYYRKKRDAVDNRIKKLLDAEFTEGSTDVLTNTIFQLEEYFESKRHEFDIPLLLVGTDFQKRVWEHLLKIPFGQASTYAQLADSMSHKQAIRAVASANGANAISIIVPCHRVIGSSGELTGYAGGLPAKEALLKLEGVHLTTESAQQCQLELL